VCRDGDRRRGGDHEADRQQRDGAQVRLEVAQVGEVRRRVQQRRQEDHQHQLRLQLGVGQAGQEAHHQPSEHQHDRVRHADRPAGGGQHGDGHQQRDQDQLDAVHQWFLS